jgi:hypothetical protein
MCSAHVMHVQAACAVDIMSWCWGRECQQRKQVAWLMVEHMSLGNTGA